MNVPYILKGLVRHQIPERWFFPLMNVLGMANLSETDPEESLSTLKRRLDSIGGDLEDKHVLEIGSGRYARLALYMLHSGASVVTLVDLYAADLSDARHKSLLLQDCARLELSADDVMAQIRVFRKDFTSLPAPVSNSRADIAASSAVLEHVRAPRRFFAACWDWLAPGGVTTHVIDLRDHGFAAPFEMLTFSDETWDRWLSPKGGFYLNRWRLPDYLEAMHDVGFVDVQYEILDRDRSALRKVAPRLNARFRGIDEDALSVLSVHLWGKKPSPSVDPLKARLNP